MLIPKLNIDLATTREPTICCPRLLPVTIMDVCPGSALSPSIGISPRTMHRSARWSVLSVPGLVIWFFCQWVLLGLRLRLPKSWVLSVMPDQIYLRCLRATSAKSQVFSRPGIVVVANRWWSGQSRRVVRLPGRSAFISRVCLNPKRQPESVRI